MTESANHFNAIAGQYDTLLPEHVQAHYRRKRARVIGPLLNGGVGLDVGCGTGALMADLRAHGTLYGVDGSAGMVGMLRRAGRGEAAVAATHLLPFADGRFDVVFSVAVLHHVAAPERVRQTVQEMARVTRPGGHVVVWDHNPRNPYWPSLMKRAPQDTGAERLIPAEEIAAALRLAGLREIRLAESGFVPEFVPRLLMPLARAAEWIVERAPLIHRLAAHNVIVARK